MAEKDKLVLQGATHSQTVRMEGLTLSAEDFPIAKNAFALLEDARLRYPEEPIDPSVDIIFKYIITNRGDKPVEVTVNESLVSQPGLVLAAASEETRITPHSMIIVRAVGEKDQTPGIVPVRSSTALPEVKTYILRAIYEQGFQAYEIEQPVSEGPLTSAEIQQLTPHSPEQSTYINQFILQDPSLKR